jgi:hypothetical protein
MTYTKSHAAAEVILIDVENNERVTLTLNPDSVYDSKDVNLASIQVPGMSHPRLQFVGGGERIVQFTAELYYGAYDSNTASFEALRMLQSFVYPEHGGTMLKRAPHRLYIDWGDLYTQNDQQWVLRRIMARSTIFHSETLAPLATSVDLEFVEYVEESIDFDTIRNVTVSF